MKCVFQSAVQLKGVWKLYDKTLDESDSPSDCFPPGAVHVIVQLTHSGLEQMAVI